MEPRPTTLPNASKKGNIKENIEKEDEERIYSPLEFQLAFPILH
jgi:hypothetical protein